MKMVGSSVCLVLCLSLMNVVSANEVTSICMEGFSGKIHRYDGAEIIEGVQESGAAVVVVGNGGSQNPTRLDQLAFIEGGGFFWDDHHASGHMLYLAQGANAMVSGGSDHRAWVSQGANIECSGSIIDVEHEMGASVPNCAAAVQVPNIPDFYRCSVDTVADEVWQAPTLAVERNGDIVTFTKTSGGTFRNTTWTVEHFYMDWRGWPPEIVKTVVATSNESQGFSANLPKVFPVSGFRVMEHYRVTMVVDTPFLGASVYQAFY